MICTVVSMVPYNMREYKPQLMPGDFAIPAAEEGDFQILHVDNCKSPVYLGEDRGYIQVTQVAEDVSKSIVDDFVSAQLALDEDSRPGMFWVPGKFSKLEIQEKFPEKLEEAKRVQHNWYRRIVTMADNDYAKTKSVRAIPDVAFLAARVLKLQNLPWMNIQNTVEQKYCPFCRAAVDSAAVICATCTKVINVPLYTSMMEAQKAEIEALAGEAEA